VLERFDRIQVTTTNRGGLASAFSRLLDAEVSGETRSEALAARRTTLRVGASLVELLEPDGAGRVQAHVAETGGGLFAAGFACRGLAALARHWERSGVDFARDGDALLATGQALGVPGLDVVVADAEPRRAVGLLRGFYEVTHLTPDALRDAKRIAEVFDLDARHFVPIRSEAYGYEGTLTLFDPARLDRVETITPHDRGKTMGRYFRKRGPCFYMGYTECDDTAKVRERLVEHAPDAWTGPRDGPAPDNLFIHPAALGGLMLGISRTTHAWSWSGSPERVEPR